MLPHTHTSPVTFPSHCNSKWLCDWKTFAPHEHLKASQSDSHLLKPMTDSNFTHIPPSLGTPLHQSAAA